MQKSLPRWLAGVLAKALVKDSFRHYQNAPAMAATLRRSGARRTLVNPTTLAGLH